ncbi:MAG: hypothetical protein ABR975_06310, partial [Vulcanimicrobiaceae bacterium]
MSTPGVHNISHRLDEGLQKLGIPVRAAFSAVETQEHPPRRIPPVRLHEAFRYGVILQDVSS